MENQTKKPIYKRWWFWVLIIVLVIAIGSGNSSNEKNTTLTSGTAQNGTENQESQKTTEDVKTEYSLGEIFKNSNIAIKYVSLDENFTGYSEYAQVKAGNKVIKAEFEAENLGSSDEYFYSGDFNCYADGYDCDDFWSVDDNSFGSTLSSGKKSKGNVYFEVPQDAEKITIEYTLNSFTGDKVVFIVK